MKNSIKEFVKLGKIPNDDDMTNELFKQYDLLLQNEEPLTYTEAELIISMFSDDCDDLNFPLFIGNIGTNMDNMHYCFYVAQKWTGG